ncbi:hypothetical protein [uncultured Luteimonas sp.]|uniref:hypothetical protein n=1 Tax=uncultured Luteimonas sp. TaxID=453144 RepID=UPI002614790C|nr:hypothetical protein [uncultured Luteimonas sp.]
MVTQGLEKAYPLATALLRLEPTEPLQRTFGWLMFELHLAGSGKLAEQISSWLRGLERNDLALTLGDVDGLRALNNKVDSLLAELKPGQRLANHKTFQDVWQDELGAKVATLMRRTPRADDDGEEDLPLSIGLLDPISAPPAADPAEPDDEPVEVLEPWRGPAKLGSLIQRRVKALARELGARGAAELRRDPDSIIPSFVAKELWERTASECAKAVSGASRESLEGHLLHLLAIETGLAPKEGNLLVFASTTDGVMLAIDLDLGVLRRPELRPPSAFSPGPDDQDLWAEVGGDILLPLSTRLQTLLRMSQQARGEDADRHGGLFLPDESNSLRQIRDSLAEVWPQGGITPFAYRRRLVAGLAASLGADAAQLTFGETFGASAAPVYYAGHRSETIAVHVAEMNSQVTGTQAAARRLALPDYRLGSRARPVSNPFSEAWEMLGSQSRRSRGRPKASTLLAELGAERDMLAVAFALCTGHRPTIQLGGLGIADLFPVAGMALIRDKQTDPSRLTRLVATGKRFMGAVERYIGSLKRIRKDFSLKEAHGAVDGLLRSELPLFTGIRDDGSPEPLDVAALFRKLPPPWSIRHNLHRHALNEALTLAGVDPELRYFQMGWVATDSHAVSDFAPYPPLSLGPALGSVIDSWLESMGWLGGPEARDPLSIHAALRLQSHEETQRLHLDEHRKQHSQLREGLLERRGTILPRVTEKLAATLEKEEAGLALRRHTIGGSVSLVRVSEGSELTVTEDLVEAVLGGFKASEPVEAHLAAQLLDTLLRRAAKAGVCKVHYLPKLVRLTTSGQPSPFIPGIGVAVTHAQLLRERLAGLAASLADEPIERQAETLAVITLLAIASHTHHRSLDSALAVLAKLRAAERSASRPWVLRIPLASGHAAVGGVVAILQNRVSITSGADAAIAELVANKGSNVGAFLKERLPELCGQFSPRQAVDRMFETLHVAAFAELDGPQRILLDGAVAPATVTAQRAASADDGFSITDRNASDEERPDDDEEEALVTQPAANPPGRPRLETRRKLEHLMKGFDPDYTGAIDGAPARPPGPRRQQLRKAVKHELANLAPMPTLLRLILEFAIHLLDERKGARGVGLALDTIYGKYNYVTRALRALPVTQSMSDLTEDELTAHIVVAVEPERAEVRADLLAAAADFLRFASLRHGVALPNLTSVQALAGEGRIRGSDPAVLNDQEAKRIISELFSNQQDSEGAPRDTAEQRFRQAQLGTALMLEASGVRPRSVYGLTLADVHLSSSGDFIHLKSRGPFASVKTNTSLGFIPLEGRLWQEHRDWFAGWYDGLRRTSPPSAWGQIPLFQQPTSPLGVRYPLSRITERIAALVKWSARDGAGRSYWFRKRRLQKRHDGVRRQQEPRARDVGRITRISGHILMTTPIASYLGDPTTYLDVIGRGELAPTRRDLAAYAGVSVNQLDQRWHRWARQRSAELTPELRVAAALASPQNNWQESSPAPLAPYRPFKSALVCASVARALPALMEGDHTPDQLSRIADELGLAVPVAEALKKATGTLCGRTGTTLSGGRADLREPRWGNGTRAIKSLLDEPDNRLSSFARRWVESALQERGERSCVFEDRSDAEGLRSVLGARGIDAEVRLTKQGLAIAVPVSGGATTYGGIQALRWVLSVAWITWYAMELLAENGRPLALADPYLAVQPSRSCA